MSQLTIVRFKITVATSAVSSAAQDLSDFELMALQMPAAWTAATITIWSAAIHDTTARRRETELNIGYDPITDSDGAALTISAAASKYIVFTQAEKELVNGLVSTKLVASADQAADRVIAAIVKPRM